MDDLQKKWTILVVDDVLTNIIILKRALINLGFNTLTAQSSVAGIAIAEKYIPDLILLDIMMPVEDGFTTIKKLKDKSITKNIPVIFLSAMTDIESKIKGFELGAVDFITKPFHPAEINARVSLHIKLDIATKALIKSQADNVKKLKATLTQLTVAQDSMLVKSSNIPNAQFATFYLPLNASGGDFYNVLKLTDDSYGYFIADVSGHDIATSFITPSVNALMKQNCSAIYAPNESMEMINNILLEVLPSGKYLTACYLTINRKINKAVIVNMGHPPIIYIPYGKTPILLEYDGDILGAFEDVSYNAHSMEISPKDRFYLYTDGLIERGDSSEVWSANLEKLLNILKDMNVQEMSLEESIKDIKKVAFLDGTEPDDDIILLGVEV